MSDVKPDPKDGGTSFFRKVVKFVANPATDWAELNSGTQEEVQQSGYAKSELKAMIERKRRNDFVRKREFDMLRKIRRDGLPIDGLAGLQASSDLDDSDPPRTNDVARPDVAVKAKIDEIEQQMEGEVIARRSMPSRPSGFYTAPTAQGQFDDAAAPLNQPFADDEPASAASAQALAPTVPLPLTPGSAAAAAASPASVAPLAWDAAPAAAGTPSAASASTAKPAPARPALGAMGSSDFSNPFAVEVNEIAHDPELDEAVISFANAEFELCERAISALIRDDGARIDHAETWLVMFDLYRATGRQQPFESLALDYVQRFGWSSPQWFSIPELVAAEPPAQAPSAAPVRVDGNVGWLAPSTLTTDDVAGLRAKTLQLPLPWVLDWSALNSIEIQACNQLRELLRHWATQKLEMRWLGTDRLLAVLADAAPTGARDADPAYWLLRLELLRLSNRPDQFDEIAIDYCVTYEVSPPSWERVLCKVKLVDGTGITVSSRSMVTDVSTGFAESQIIEETSGVRTAAVELSGQLVGDIGKVLAQLEAKLGTASVVNINCARLIRMDFVAAGDLLNWVLQRRTEERLVHFDDAHRLLALFFNAMGINEHARVKVRNV